MFEAWMLAAMEEAGFMTTGKDKTRPFPEGFETGKLYEDEDDEDDEDEL